MAIYFEFHPNFIPRVSVYSVAPSMKMIKQYTSIAPLYLRIVSNVTVEKVFSAH